ncbi:MAG: hypothetical protein K0S76_2094 [Herbinix sp.]|nr:hypothetical protein [Herbinix sp.]
MKKKRIFPPTSFRVFLRTKPPVNAEIRNQTIRNLNILKNCNEAEMTDRIRSLNSEWDTERILEVNAAALILLSSYLGIRTSRCWFLLTGTIGVFLLLHALQGWCPPLPIIRKWGIRTEDEINSEKIVLKLLRGDFKSEGTTVVDLLNAVEKQ